MRPAIPGLCGTSLSVTRASSVEWVTAVMSGCSIGRSTVANRAAAAGATAARARYSVTADLLTTADRPRPVVVVRM